MTVAYSIGSLVKARGRDWVVQPESDADGTFLILSPLDGASPVQVGIDTELETVEPASFILPTIHEVEVDGGSSIIGNLAQSRLLRDAVRLSFRNAAGPFRSLSRIGVEPRPYQLVPLMMALRMETIRLLIADDVGIGKTVEALLIARELIDRGEIERFTVLCPPHLAEQWKDALTEQFGFEDVTLVLASTAKRLERRLIDGDDSIFLQHPITVVSLDFIKQEERAAMFLRTCPDLVIVDEAHGCTEREGRRGNKQIRHQLLKSLSEDLEQHLILVTATPHSGHQDAFASLMGLLDPSFKQLALKEYPSQPDRARIAKHLVQRRRVDIRRDFDDMGTTFPDRLERTQNYSWGNHNRTLFNDVVEWSQGRMNVAVDKRTKRVRYWSMLSLMRAMASSPAAAIAGLQTRQVALPEETDTSVRPDMQASLFDMQSEHGLRDEVLGGDELGVESEHEIVNGFISRFESSAQDKDPKVLELLKIIKAELKSGFAPIVFCRFVPTVDYLVKQLAAVLPKNIMIQGITGRLPPEVRLRRVSEFAEVQPEQRVLICTDCLSEGVNLQDNFTSVIHYDLSWSPTAHEQREGRVDRFGQLSPVVHAIALVGENNVVDGIVLNTIIEKQRTIRKALGISVPAPNAMSAITNAIDEGFLSSELRTTQLTLFEGEEHQQYIEQEWMDAANRESKRRSIFAQGTIHVDEVKHEVAEVREALGSPQRVADFLESTIQFYGGHPERDGNHLTFTSAPLDSNLKAVQDWKAEVKYAIVDDLSPVQQGFERIVRTSPVVERLANQVMGSSLDHVGQGYGRRLSVTRTDSVEKRTNLLLARARFSLTTTYRQKQTTVLVEELITLGFHGELDNPQWMTQEEVSPLWDAQATGNIQLGQAETLLKPLLSRIHEGVLDDPLREEAERIKRRVEESHLRVRAVLSEKGSLEVHLHEPMDILSLSVLLPEVKLDD
jgi:superfamily II DNA or RNA helicase